MGKTAKNQSNVFPFTHLYLSYVFRHGTQVSQRLHNLELQATPATMPSGVGLSSPQRLHNLELHATLGLWVRIKARGPISFLLRVASSSASALSGINPRCCFQFCRGHSGCPAQVLQFCGGSYMALREVREDL